MQDELHDLHSLPNRLLLGHVAGAGENTNAQNVLMDKLAENSWKTLGTDGRIIPKHIYIYIHTRRTGYRIGFICF